MSEVEEIENAVKNLPASELRRFREWFDALDAETWDAQVEADAAAGKLDALADAAIADHERGNSKSL